MTPKWLIAMFAVAGAFLISGVLGSFVAGLFWEWSLLGAGFAAAFSVVCVAYLAAPDHKFIFSVVTFVIGAVVAWLFLEPSWYPENHATMAYQPTHLPLVTTYVGGVLGLLVVALLNCRATNA